MSGTPEERPPAPEPTVLTDEAFLPPPAPPRRSTRGVKWLLILSSAFGGMVLLGCLVLGLWVQGERSTAPEDVLQAAREITELELPAGYQGELAETVSTPLFSVRKAVFRHESGKGVLWLTEMKIFLGDDKLADESVKQNMEQLITDMRQIVATDEAPRTVTIRGETAEFQLRTGTDTLSSTRLHEVRGKFRGKTGVAELWWQAEAAVGERQPMEALVDSLR